MNCLIISSAGTALMPSEAQELMNLWTKTGWKMTILQSQQSSLEIYRLSEERYSIVWVISHSTNEGFVLGDFVLTPEELGLFTRETKTKELILNSCNSARHIPKIRSVDQHVSILATTTAVEDEYAWRTALYLGKEIVRTWSVSTAFINMGNKDYWWEPGKVEVVEKDTREARETDITVERLVRAISGDTFSRQPGLIASMQSLESKIHEYIASDQEWKRNTELRIKQLEQNKLSYALGIGLITVATIVIILYLYAVFGF